jgi:hypothetical protein
MTDIAIRVENCILSRVEGLSQLYHIGARQERHDTLRDALGSWKLAIRDWGRRFRHPTSSLQPPTTDDTDLWALRDVSFESLP